MWVNCALLGEMEQFTMSDVLRGKYCKAKVEKTDKELDRHHKTRFKGNCHVLGEAKSAVLTEKIGIDVWPSVSPTCDEPGTKV